MPGGLHARLCHAFLVSYIMLRLQLHERTDRTASLHFRYRIGGEQKAGYKSRYIC